MLVILFPFTLRLIATANMIPEFSTAISDDSKSVYIGLSQSIFETRFAVMPFEILHSSLPVIMNNCHCKPPFVNSIIR